MNASCLRRLLVEASSAAGGARERDSRRDAAGDRENMEVFYGDGTDKNESRRRYIFRLNQRYFLPKYIFCIVLYRRKWCFIIYPA
jgi:hypothetical protein